MADAVPASRTDWAHRRLKGAILTGELGPGAKLVVETLAARWAVSPTPLREAFQRLGGSGLVELTSQRGARVAPFSLAEAADLYEIRLLLEPRAVAQSIRASDDGHRAEVLAAHQRLARAAAGRPCDPVELAEAHLAFHTALVARCPSAWLRRLVALLAEHAQRYQLLGARRHRRGSDPRREHATLCDAAVRGQGARAARLLTRHLEATLGAVRAGLDADTPPAQAATRRS